MNTEIFEKWFEESLLPALDRPSLIVMDNASYHSRRLNKMPTSKDTKIVIINWLNSNNIEFPKISTKIDLLKIVKLHSEKFPKIYSMDQMAELHGHRVLRLPPYHSELNPIELIWVQIKLFVARENKT